MNEHFRKIAAKISLVVGTPWAFVLAIVIILAWFLSGPLFGFSDTWQLIINTGTTIITFLMVFLIQNTQNRDAKAIHLKLDELIKSTRSANNQMLNVEDVPDEELERLHQEFKSFNDNHNHPKRTSQNKNKKI